MAGQAASAGSATSGVVRVLYYNPAVIRSFADSKTRRLFEEDRQRGFRGLDYDRALLLLDTLDAAPSLDSLRALRSVRLHALSGKRKGTSSMTINARWRLTFRFARGNAQDVAIEDYHKG
ncbi:MAG: type II toxin-antitoxin system RelE/ParE family toxin [Acidobacteriota bacterium]|nr:type II toxin-antitoxin system RelE/ParE family toxin [Acidobacteriota bacterium]